MALRNDCWSRGRTECGPPVFCLSLVAVVFLTLTAAVSGKPRPVVLVKKGRPRARIYVCGPIQEDLGRKVLPRQRRRTPRLDPDQAARSYAVSDLNYHLEKMTGTKLEVVQTDDPKAVRAPAIVLGRLAVKFFLRSAKPAKTCKSGEGYRILTRAGLVLIGGETDRAVLNGVYDLLGMLGCDWVMPGAIGEVIPQRKTVVAPGTDRSSVPSFLTRRLWYRGYNQPRLPEESARMAEWLRRQRGGSWVHPLLSTSGHVWQGLIRKHQAEFKKDPTMFALRRAPDGTLQRRGPQLESTHPRVVELFAADIKAAYKRNIAAGQWTRDTVGGFGIGPADGLGYSLSAESLLASSGRMDPIIGERDRTDELILLGNHILAKVHQDYPNAYVGFYSYSTHADFPMRYKPDPKIVQIFAPINFSRFHSVLDANSKTQAYYRNVVEQWGRLSREQGNVLFYRGYNWNLADNMLPYSKVRIWGEELPFYQKQGIVGLNVEATKAWSVNGPSDYVFMKLAWDSSQDWRDLLADYCRKAFGRGAKPMLDYFGRIIKAQHGAGQEAGSYHAFQLIYSPEWITASGKLLAAARKAARTPANQRRIEHFALGLEALKLYINYYTATTRFDFAAAKTAYDAMLAHWQKTYDMNTDLVANETPAYLKRFIATFVDGGLKYSSKPYQIACRIPEMLPTMFDPHEVGHRMNYHMPDINDSRFIKTHTYAVTWDAQGLAGIRSGAVWYRVHFKLPADVRGQAIGLFIGGVEDEARVWINGKPVGTSGRRFSVPVLFDLTDGINYRGDNLLAIQVVRNSKANEIGLGGILRPSFVFAGPRLAKKATQPLKLRRVLPGGGLGQAE